MDGKRDFYCRIAADVLLIVRDGFSSCAAIDAVALVWVAGRCDLGCKHLYFHTDCGIARDFVWFLPAYHAEQQRYFAHWYLLVVQRHGIACRPYGLEKKNIIEKSQGYG